NTSGASVSNANEQDNRQRTRISRFITPPKAAGPDPGAGRTQGKPRIEKRFSRHPVNPSGKSVPPNPQNQEFCARKGSRNLGLASSLVRRLTEPRTPVTEAWGGG